MVAMNSVGHALESVPNVDCRATKSYRLIGTCNRGSAAGRDSIELIDKTENEIYGTFGVRLE